ncbi:MAG: PSD1 and planctomycete cytochrome C domain-containing protein [Saprospiraceae bacterium]|jgi:phage protein U
MGRIFWGIGLLFGALFSCTSSNDRISFNEDVRPILNQNCLPCHGGVKANGGFSLLFEADAFAVNNSGQTAIIRGNARKSELYKRIIHQNPELRMPLDAPPLSEDEIGVLKKWINQGAQWEEHWAYQKPVTPIHIPKDQHPIDYFVQRKLKEQGLTPSAKAALPTLLRRLSLDLTGLPPQKEWLNQMQEGLSYEDLVDSLLDAPSFGEKWASMWLDLARYSDTKGYEKDPHRNIWRYRDWVVKAFNQDMPLDSFTIRQLAGDMLDLPTTNDLIATAFHRNTMTNTEGGTDDEEFRVAAVIDRLNTTYEVWQGTTMSCVQCHSHPYDPIRQEDFYGSYGYFNQTVDADLDLEVPVLEIYPPEKMEEMEELIKEIASLSPRTPPEFANDPYRLKQFIFPILMPYDAADFENVSFYGDGSVTNWIYNLQSMTGKRFRFSFPEIPLSGLIGIKMEYESKGGDAAIEIRGKEAEGVVLNHSLFSAPENGRGVHEIKFSPQDLEGSGLFFEIINTSGKIPEGMVIIRRMELAYESPSFFAEGAKEKINQLIALRRQNGDRTPVIRSKSKDYERANRLFVRGNWMALGDSIPLGVPAAINQQEEYPTNRLEFAQWLVHTDNPLTSRVMVNRFWQEIFGRGLVLTSEDFGTMGEPPSHPELLDYLAVQFSTTYQWSVKKLLKHIVLSQTYQQSSKMKGDDLVDPDNQWLSRGPRWRLSAEQIRDQILAVSGLLYDTLGGPSVMPYQPEGIWQSVYSGAQWTLSEGRHAYRRALYTYQKRTAPYPNMITFDAPSREFCVSRRITTNTPLQALALLNDPAFYEAAEHFGNTMKKKGKGDLKAALRYGYQQALFQEPDEEEIQILLDLCQNAESEDPLTLAANVLFNLDGFLTKE